MGSKLGWILAIVLAVVVVIAVVIGVLVTRSATTPPTSATTRGGVLMRKTVSVPIGQVVGATPAAGGNAATDYAAALALLEANHSEISQAGGVIERARDGRPDLSSARLDLLKKIHQQVSAGAARESFAWPIAEFEITYEYPPALRLQQLHGAVYALGEYFRKAGQFDQAEKVFRDDMILGWHLAGERGRAMMVSSGLGIQMDALNGLRRLYQQQGGHTNELDTLRRYEDERSGVSLAYRQKAEIIWTARPHPGDVFNIIANDQDRAWRTEALLSLGILKFTQEGVPGNARHIRNLLATYAASDDPYLSRAARTAEAATEQDLADQGILIQ